MRPMAGRTSAAPCPYCKAHTVGTVFSAPHCTNCGTSWEGYRAWRKDCHKLGVKPGAGAGAGAEAVEPEPEPEDTYISSGDMKRDVEAVVEIAVLESEFATIKRLAHNVANKTQESMDRGDPAQATVDIILMYITEEVKDVMRKQGKDVP